MRTRPPDLRLVRTREGRWRESPMRESHERESHVRQGHVRESQMRENAVRENPAREARPRRRAPATQVSQPHDKDVTRPIKVTDRLTSRTKPRLASPSRGQSWTVAMSEKDPPGSKRADRSDWSSAWEVVARLAAAREATLRTLGQDRRKAPPIRASKRNATAAPKPDASSAKATAEQSASAPAKEMAKEATKQSPKPASDQIAAPAAPIDPDQLARAVAEIEKASAALREAEPGLEVGLPDAPSHRRKYWSIWLLVGAVWISATLVVAGATGAILYVFG
jgi:hypothetical protein